MTALTAGDQQDQRIAALEDRLASAVEMLGGELAQLDARVGETEHALAAAGAPALRTIPLPSPAARPHPATARPAAARSAPAVRRRPQRSYGDLIGGRLLAWAGGVALLLGIVLFLALAISHGWIGESARVLLAGSGSLALLGAGSWLRSRRGRTDAAVAMVGAAVAGLFATLVVASAGYHLLPGLLALAGALAVGATATVLSIRWAGRPLAGIGLVGALAAPALVGAPAEWPTLAMMLATAGCAMWVAARQRWAWLSLATVIVTAPQWAVPMLEGQSAGEDLGVLVPFAVLGLAGAVASARSGAAEETERRAPAALAALALNALILALIGRAALAWAGGAALGDAWVAVLAGAHLALGAAPRRLGVGARLRAVLLALGVALADVALALAADGLTLAVTWGASAVVLGAVTRRAARDGRGTTLRELGVGTQISLALIRTLIVAPPAALGGGIGASGLAALAALAASALATAQLLGDRHSAVRAAVAGLGLAAIAYLTAMTLDGPALVAAWAAEAGTLLALGARLRDPVARWGGALYAAAATLYTLGVVAPPTALGGTGAALGGAAIALAALAGLAWRARLLWARDSRPRALSCAAAGGALLYLASLAVASLPQGQLLLSALWGVCGVAALLAGLRTDSAPVRNVALGLLLATIAKVFLYDLSTLDSLARVASFLVLGTLLLGGAFAYQRLRPPAQPDMRSVHPSQR